jgi:hypothetical protein
VHTPTANARGERPPPTGMVERTRNSRTAARRRARVRCSALVELSRFAAEGNALLDCGRLVD